MNSFKQLLYLWKHTYATAIMSPSPKLTRGRSISSLRMNSFSFTWFGKDSLNINFDYSQNREEY